MKKLKAFLLIIVILSTLVMSVFSLSSCKKTVTYQIAGLYIELVEDKVLFYNWNNKKIKLPEYVENFEIKDYNMLYGDGLNIESVEKSYILQKLFP